MSQDVSSGVKVHWIAIKEEPSVIYPWPRERERVIVWNRIGFVNVATIYNGFWNIDGRPVDKRFLTLNFSHWAAVPRPLKEDEINDTTQQQRDPTGCAVQPGRPGGVDLQGVLGAVQSSLQPSEQEPGSPDS